MTKSYEELLSENEALHRSLDESQELLQAISSGEVDALVLTGQEGDQVFTLNGADRAYRILIESMNDGAVTIDPEGIILYCNCHFAEMVKLPLEKVIGTSIYDFLPQAEQASFRVLTQRQGRSELTLRADDGSILPVYISINSLQISQAQKTFCVAVTNLTEQKHKEEIIAAEKLARSIIEQANEAILVCDASGRITHFSNAVLKVLGYDPSLQSFNDLFDLQLPHGKMLSPVSTALQGEMLEHVETSFERSDGARFYFLTNAGPLKSADGRVIGCVITLTDITERKQTEEALQVSEARFRSVLDNSRDVIYRLNLQTGHYEYISPSAEKVVGYSPDELMAQGTDTALAMVHSDDLPAVIGKIARLEDTGQEELEYRQQSKNDGYRWLSNYISLIKDRDGRTLFRDGNIRDITERKIAELEKERLLAELALEKTRWAATVDNMLDLVTVCDAQGGVTYINPAYHCLIERSLADELPLEGHPEYYQLYRPDGTFFPAEDLPLQKAALTGGDVHDVEIIHRSSNGSEFTAIFSASPLKSSDGSVIGAVAVGHDITEKKKAEEELRRSEVRYRSLFNSMTEGFALHEIICDDQGKPCDFKFLDINPAFERLTGLRREDVIGKTHNMVLPDDDPIWVKSYGAVALTGEPTQFENYSPALGKYYEVFAYRPAPLQFAVAFMDVTTRKHAEICLQNNLQRFYRVLSAMYAGILLVAENGEIEYANQAFCDLFGLTVLPEELMGLTSHEMIEKIRNSYLHPDEAVARIEELVRQGEPVKGEEVSLQGGRTYIRDFIPLFADGRSNGRLWHHRDITERKRMEEELKESKDQLEQRVQARTEELNALNESLRLEIDEHERSEKALLIAKNDAEEAMKAKAAFMANMSHELRTPMNSVIGFTGLLLDENLSPEQKDYLECIRNSGEALMSLINDVLDFSKMEKKKMDLELQVFDLRSIIEEALDMLAAQAAKKSLEMNYSFDRNVPEAIIGDPGKLRQVLSNLLSNAVKFTKTGEVVVYVSSDTQQGEIHFAVRDTGIGIPKEGMSKLFLPFSQLDMTHSREYEGTGLGLAISKKLVELMEGRIWVESEVGQGSVFHFTILADTVPSEPKPNPVGILEGKRVLMFTESQTLRRILGRQAHSWGMVPMMTAKLQETAELLQRDRDYDAVIFDASSADALAMIIRIRSLCRDLPFITLAPLGHNMPQGIFQVVLTKPLKNAQLLRALQDVLESGTTLEPLDNHEPQRSSETLRILLAEDNASNKKVTLHILNRLGYRADAVVNGQEALAALERQPYDIVLMDVEMPVMDGITATMKIRERWPGNIPRIIAITAYAQRGDKERCLDAGMDDYIPKPVRKGDLEEMLAKYKSHHNKI